ncbi:MAG: hypothetical protein RI953_1306 [Pseudomonadota bacterium]
MAFTRFGLFSSFGFGIVVTRNFRGDLPLIELRAMSFAIRFAEILIPFFASERLIRRRP